MMFISSILKNFNPKTKIEYYIDGSRIRDIRTVEDWLDSGLCNMIVLEENNLLKIERDCIIINIGNAIDK